MARYSVKVFLFFALFCFLQCVNAEAHQTQQYIYVGAGTYILQYRIAADGALVPLRPDRVKLPVGSLERWYVELLPDAPGRHIVARALRNDGESGDVTTAFSVRANGTLGRPVSGLAAETLLQNIHAADPAAGLKWQDQHFSALDRVRYVHRTLDGKTAYIGEEYDTVYQFRVEADGTLTTLHPGYVRVRTGYHPRMSMTVDGRFAFCNGDFYAGHAVGYLPQVKNYSDAVGWKVSQFRINQDGTLSYMPLMPGVRDKVCFPWVFDRTGRFAYGIDTQGRGLAQMRLNSDGQLTPVRWRPVPRSGPPQPEGFGHGLAYPFLMTSLTR